MVSRHCLFLDVLLLWRVKNTHPEVSFAVKPDRHEFISGTFVTFFPFSRPIRFRVASKRSAASQLGPLTLLLSASAHSTLSCATLGLPSSYSSPRDRLIRLSVSRQLLEAPTLLPMRQRPPDWAGGFEGVQGPVSYFEKVLPQYAVPVWQSSPRGSAL